MASNSSRQTSRSPQSDSKVFDVMRPGRVPVSATSRPVIVGHKPQVQDPMMSKDADDQKRSLMNANQKITVQPLSGAGGITMDEDKKQPTTDANLTSDAPQAPSLDDSLSSDQQSSMPQSPGGDSMSEKNSADMPEPWTPSDTNMNSSSTPQDSPANPMPSTSDSSANNDLSPDDLAAMNTPSTPPVSSSVDSPDTMPEAPIPSEPATPYTTPANNPEPLPKLPEEQPDRDMIVSHHSHGAGMTLLWVVIIIILAIVVFNFLLDLEIITIDSFPHTNWL